jgi:hypothetical protein
MTEWYCDTCNRTHAKADECDLYTGRQVLTGKALKDYQRRTMMHAKNPPKGGCLVIALALAAVPMGIWYWFG